MPYQYLEDEALADIAFKAWGEDLNHVFKEAAKAVYSLLTNVDELTDELTFPINIESDSTEKLLYKFLDEIIYLKDAELFFPKNVEVSIKETDGTYSLIGRFYGCEFDFERHHMGNDIKAITYHDFYLKQVDNKWECYVLVDI
ncbi:MAG: archease [Candidatus Kariarchaeaceae archaeon]|jgi:SHS2 domain-containing protein